MQAVSLYDTITIEPSDTLELISDLKIPERENLVYKAAEVFFARKELNTTHHSSRITLKKEIPAQAGLGGGSSDAAHTLVGLNKLFGDIYSVEELSSMAAELGSDVPFFISGGFAVVEGRGEKVIPHKVNSTISLLLIHPPFPISTAWAYGQFAGRGFTAIPDPGQLRDNLITALESYDFKCLAGCMKNDIEDVLKDRFPAIQEIEKAMLKAGAEAAMLSGSGSAVFGVFKDAKTLDKAAQSLAAHYTDCLIKKATTHSK
ncbi:4-diphosphocytidyl-2-C-methyl-D-erythritol kinase [Candidatus Magnetominusculus xianensis]|uniref:4-diphosphocytidyl-2-C-methyl-D-erythritol kinase n=2 Tax=Candidatus Magnetominusculus xianensis TaxID=1748249 RepID=A0ABR5SEC5_9BACT|nr:4-diphosphocytidyl-2-C-methyl-D-erythritol kinase [Candidatus Magnetominusculus xianensis]